MSEESLRELIGLAKKSNWIHVKKYIKFIVQKTLKKEAGYSLTALDVSINGRKQPKLTLAIKNKEMIKEIDKITDFDHLSLYQATENSNNLIEVSQNNGTLIVLAKYLGPSLNNHQIFDFSVHLDALDDPFFTIGNGKKLDSSEVLKIINKKTELTIKTRKEKEKKESKEVEEIKIQDIEVFVFEKLTEKNANWNGTETKTFLNWKAKLKNKYRIESGNISYYKGKPTKKYSIYLENLLKNKDNKAKKPTKKINKTKPSSKKVGKEISEQFIFKTLTGKNATWNGAETKTFQNWKAKMKKIYCKESGNVSYYKGKPTKKYSLYLENLLKNKDNKAKKPTKKINKTKPSSKKVGKEISEQFIFKTLTGKNATWNGAETKTFQNWKAKMKKIYCKESGNVSYYKGKPTKKYSLYLENLLKNKDNKAKKPIKNLKKKEPSSKKVGKEISEQFTFKTLTGKNAIWKGSKTKNFLDWKSRNYKKYTKDTGKNPYYRGKLTQNFQKYLKNLIKFR